jgi:cyclopropane fatty-acyl-phospholipid synthase-like methyltransferase
MEEIYFEIFESLPRQGPGDAESTRKAFDKLTGLPKHPEILDIGCGSGGQTLILAKLSSGNITALDNHEPFIKKLNRDAKKAGCDDRIQCVVGDMRVIGYPKESFDLIWSEGAAYIMGFDNALKSWRALLRPKGYLAVSELVWFKKRAPKEVKDFFAREYPDMKHYKDIYPLIEASGYKMIDYSPLPNESWWTHYYTPVEKKLVAMRRKYQDNQDAQAIFDSFQLEIDIHRKYPQYYGYGFYIMQKIKS